MKKICVYLLAILFISVGCGNSENQLIRSDQKDSPVAFKLPAENQNNSRNELNDQNINSQIYPKKIIKNGNITIASNNLTDDKKIIDQTIKQFDGYYLNEEFNNDDYAKSYRFTIKIPADNFEKLLETIDKSKLKVISKNISSEDITANYVDTEIRLKNQKEFLQRYQDLLQKTNKISEIIEIEQKIQDHQISIEQTEGYLKLMQNQVALSNLVIELRKEINTSTYSHRSFWERLGDSFSNSISYLGEFVLIMIQILPVLIIIFFIGLLIFYLIRKILNRSKTKLINKK